MCVVWFSIQPLNLKITCIYKRVKMQDERDTQLSDPFDMFGGFGNFGSFDRSTLGRNLFDDPFFTRPFGHMFPSNGYVPDSPLVVPPSGPMIEELGSDDEIEEEMEDNAEEDQRSSRPVNEPYVDHPDDETGGKCLQVYFPLRLSFVFWSLSMFVAQISTISSYSII